jgi:hypothetical protein
MGLDMLIETMLAALCMMQTAQMVCLTAQWTEYQQTLLDQIWILLQKRQSLRW